MASFGAASKRKVATSSGNFAGELSDVHIDPATGKIRGYEVTGGIFARMFGVTHTIEASEHTRLGKDLLIVADELLVALTETSTPLIATEGPPVTLKKP